MFKVCSSLVDEQKEHRVPTCEHLTTCCGKVFTPATFILFLKVKTVIKGFQQVRDVTAKLNAVPLMVGLCSY